MKSFIIRDCACCSDQPTVPPDCPACHGAGGFTRYQIADGMIAKVSSVLSSRTPAGAAGDPVGEDISQLEADAWGQASTVSCYWIKSKGDTDLVQVANRDLRLLYEATHTLATQPASPAPTPSPESTLSPAQVAPRDGGGMEEPPEVGETAYRAYCEYAAYSDRVPPRSWNMLDGRVKVCWVAAGKAAIALATRSASQAPSTSPESTLSTPQVPTDGVRPVAWAYDFLNDPAKDEWAIRVSANRLVETFNRRNIRPLYEALATTPASAGEGDLREAEGPVERAVWAASRFFEHLERIAYRDSAGMRLSPAHVVYESTLAQIEEAKAALARHQAPAVDVPAERERERERVEAWLQERIVATEQARDAYPDGDEKGAVLDGAIGAYVTALALVRRPRPDAILDTRPTDPGGARGWKPIEQFPPRTKALFGRWTMYGTAGQSDEHWNWEEATGTYHEFEGERFWNLDGRSFRSGAPFYGKPPTHAWPLPTDRPEKPAASTASSDAGGAE